MQKMRLPGPLALLLSAVLTCVVTSASHAAGCPATLRANQVCLYLKWPLQFQSIGYYVAKERGLYDEKGLDVHIIEPPLDLTERASIADTVVEGIGRYGIGTSGLLIDRFDRGRPIVALAALFQESPLVLLVRESSGVRTPSDLQARPVMLEPGAEELEAYFRKHGVNSESFLPPGGFFDVQRFIEGKVDAMSAYATDELKVITDEGVEARIFRPSTAAINFYTDVLFTSEAELDQKPARAYHFLQASMAGWKWAFTHVNEAIDLIEHIQERRQREGLAGPVKSRDRLKFEADQMRRLVGPISRIGHMDPLRWNHIAGIYSGVGMLQNTPRIDEFLRTDIRNPNAWRRIVPFAGGGVVAVFVMLAIAFELSKALSISKGRSDASSIGGEAGSVAKTINENRRVIAPHLITVLFGLAVTNMMGTLAQTTGNEGIGFPNAALAGVFFLVSLRFLIGNQVHISSDEMGNQALAWLFDLTVITFQFSLMIFLANVSTVEASQAREYGFFEILFIIYAIDVVWIALQRVPSPGNHEQTCLGNGCSLMRR